MIALSGHVPSRLSPAHHVLPGLRARAVPFFPPLIGHLHGAHWLTAWSGARRSYAPPARPRPVWLQSLTAATALVTGRLTVSAVEIDTASGHGWASAGMRGAAATSASDIDP